MVVVNEGGLWGIKGEFFFSLSLDVDDVDDDVEIEGGRQCFPFCHLRLSV